MTNGLAARLWRARMSALATGERLNDFIYNITIMAVNCDILVIGGGVMGTSIAWHLAKRRVGRVILLEKSFLGAGSSGKSGAIIRQHYSNRLTAAMAQKGLRVFEHFDDVVGGPPVFTRTGMVLVVKEADR